MYMINGYGYRYSSSASMGIYSLADPLNPTLVGSLSGEYFLCISRQIYIHQRIHAGVSQIIGRSSDNLYLYGSDSSKNFYVVSITNPVAPQIMAKTAGIHKF